MGEIIKTMITYELAKKLKDAGFNSKEVKKYSYKDGKFHDDYDVPDGLLLPDPTLSELIEACGDKFENLKRDGNSGEYAWRTNYIYDSGQEYDDYACTSEANGSSPEEAVANLYLSLNSK